MTACHYVFITGDMVGVDTRRTCLVLSQSCLSGRCVRPLARPPARVITHHRRRRALFCHPSGHPRRTAAHRRDRRRHQPPSAPVPVRIPAGFTFTASSAGAALKLTFHNDSTRGHD